MMFDKDPPEADGAISMTLGAAVESDAATGARVVAPFFITIGCGPTFASEVVLEEASATDAEGFDVAFATGSLSGECGLEATGSGNFCGAGCDMGCDGDEKGLGSVAGLEAAGGAETLGVEVAAGDAGVDTVADAEGFGLSSTGLVFP